MVGYVLNNAFFREFSDYLLKFGAAYHVPVCAIPSQNIIKHFHGEPLYAEVWDGGRIAAHEVDFPTYLDTSGKIYSDKYAAHFETGFISWLKSKTSILSQKSISKEKLVIAMLSSELSLYAIPTWHIETYSQLENTLIRLKQGLMKPTSGRKGKGVCKLHMENGKIIVQTSTSISHFNEECFLSYISDIASNHLGETALLQPCFDFSLDDCHAVDFRLLRHRGRSGEWEEVATYARVGATSLVSNVSQGGFIADARETLQMIAGNSADALYEEIMYIGEALPPLIQRFRGNDAYCLGLDIAIDRQSMRPFVLEANTYPGTKFHICQLAEKRVQYYRYLLDNQ